MRLQDEVKIQSKKKSRLKKLNTLLVDEYRMYA